MPGPTQKSTSPSLSNTCATTAPDMLRRGADSAPAFPGVEPRCDDSIAGRIVPRGLGRPSMAAVPRALVVGGSLIVAALAVSVAGSPTAHREPSSSAPAVPGHQGATTGRRRRPAAAEVRWRLASQDNLPADCIPNPAVALPVPRTSWDWWGLCTAGP